MPDATAQGSEVARLLRQIRDEYTSAQQGLKGLAYGTSQFSLSRDALLQPFLSMMHASIMSTNAA